MGGGDTGVHIWKKFYLTLHLNSQQVIESKLCPYLGKYLLGKKSLCYVVNESEGSKTGIRKVL